MDILGFAFCGFGGFFGRAAAGGLGGCPLAVDGGNVIEIDWALEDGYYLYKDKISASALSAFLRWVMSRRLNCTRVCSS